MDCVVLARETGAMEMREMKEKVDIEIEAFYRWCYVIAHSGRCTLSNHMTARDSNRGGCCQSCRWDYELLELMIMVNLMYFIIKVKLHRLR